MKIRCDTTGIRVTVRYRVQFIWGVEPGGPLKTQIATDIG